MAEEIQGTGVPPSRRARRRRFRDLPLLWKLLLPSLILVLAAGALGGVLIARDLSSRARTTLNQTLIQASLRARAILQNREVSLLEAVNLAANVEGMPERVERRDAKRTGELLRSVLALKTDLHVVVVTDPSGRPLVAFTRERDGDAPREARFRGWTPPPPAREAVTATRGHRSAGIVLLEDRPLLMLAAPVCAGTRCTPVGAAVVGAWLDVVLGEGAARPTPGGIAVYAATGERLAGAGLSSPVAGVKQLRDDEVIRRTERVAKTEIATMYAPLPIQGRRQGLLSVSLPTAPTLAALRGTGLRLGLILFAAMAGLVLIGVFVSRIALGQVRPLLATSRALGQGELGQRAPVLGNDELGELAQRFNEMADRLQASYETLEAKVAERTEEIERLLRQRTDFFASVSHELRTPLAVILSRAKTMLSPTYRKNARSTADALRTIRDSGQQLLSVVNEILEIARADAGTVELTVSEIAIGEVIAVLRRTIDGLASARGIVLSVDVGTHVPDVRADPERLHQVLLNLVDNALKYTPSGGRVDVSATSDAGGVRVSVADTGVGISERYGERIFELFYRVPGVRTQHGEAGSGLGLPLAKRIVEAHGGRIWHEQRPGGGTVLSMWLPAIDPRRSGNGQVPGPHLRAPTESRGRGTTGR